MGELSPRATSLELLRSDQLAAAPVDPGYEPNSPEALAFLDGLKEPHYASLAITIDTLFDAVNAQKARRTANDGLARSRVGDSLTPWLALRADFLETFNKSTIALIKTPAFEQTQHYTSLIGTLDTRRYMSLAHQLDAGSETAITTMHVFLKNLPGLLKAFGSDAESVDYASVARASLGLPWRLAVTCVNRMMAARDILTDNNWSAGKARLNPDQFVLRSSNNGARLQYRDFSGLEAPAGWTPMEGIPPLQATTKIGELACEQSKIVGCPFTLLQGRFEELWHWYIDCVEARGLWDTKR